MSGILNRGGLLQSDGGGGSREISLRAHAAHICFASLPVFVAGEEKRERKEEGGREKEGRGRGGEGGGGTSRVGWRGDGRERPSHVATPLLL